MEGDQVKPVFTHNTLLNTPTKHVKKISGIHEFQKIDTGLSNLKKEIKKVNKITALKPNQTIGKSSLPKINEELIAAR